MKGSKCDLKKSKWDLKKILCYAHKPYRFSLSIWIGLTQALRSAALWARSSLQATVRHNQEVHAACWMSGNARA